jgi:hypothetical protein
MQCETFTLHLTLGVPVVEAPEGVKSNGMWSTTVRAG